MFLTGRPAKKSPLVLLGAVSTAGVLVGGLLAFKKVRVTLGPRASAALPLHSSHCCFAPPPGKQGPLSVPHAGPRPPPGACWEQPVLELRMSDARGGAGSDCGGYGHHQRSVPSAHRQGSRAHPLEQCCEP